MNTSTDAQTITIASGRTMTTADTAPLIAKVVARTHLTICEVYGCPYCRALVAEAEEPVREKQR